MQIISCIILAQCGAVARVHSDVVSWDLSLTCFFVFHIRRGTQTKKNKRKRLSFRCPGAFLSSAPPSRSGGRSVTMCSVAILLASTKIYAPRKMENGYCVSLFGPEIRHPLAGPARHRVRSRRRRHTPEAYRPVCQMRQRLPPNRPRLPHGTTRRVTCARLSPRNSLSLTARGTPSVISYPDIASRQLRLAFLQLLTNRALLNSPQYSHRQAWTCTPRRTPRSCSSRSLRTRSCCSRSTAPRPSTPSRPRSRQSSGPSCSGLTANRTSGKRRPIVCVGPNGRMFPNPKLCLCL